MYDAVSTGWAPAPPALGRLALTIGGIGLAGALVATAGALAWAGLLRRALHRAGEW